MLMLVPTKGEGSIMMHPTIRFSLGSQLPSPESRVCNNYVVDCNQIDCNLFEDYPNSMLFLDISTRKIIYKNEIKTFLKQKHFVIKRGCRNFNNSFSLGNYLEISKDELYDYVSQLNYIRRF